MKLFIIDSGTGLFGSLLTTVALNVKDLLHGRNIGNTIILLYYYEEKRILLIN